jgi:hypothetical protein
MPFASAFAWQANINPQDRQFACAMTKERRNSQQKTLIA